MNSYKVNELTKREKAIYENKLAGIPIYKTAKELGICMSTASQSYHRARRKIDYFKGTNMEVKVEHNSFLQNKIDRLENQVKELEQKLKHIAM